MDLEKFLEENQPVLENNYFSNEERLRLIKVYDNLLEKPEGFDEYLLEHTSPKTIDYIFPYVDSSDPIWRKKFFKAAENFNGSTNFEVRFDGDKESLKGVFRGLDRYMPWISIVHFIVSEPSQIPEWLDQDKVHIVYHKDFIPKQYLPTFNSCTIEIFLHKVVGLAEKFIYGNDDFYPVGDMKPLDFFKGNKPVTELNYQDWPYALHITENMKMAEQCTKTIKDGINGIKQFVTHTSLSFLKSSYKSIYEEFKNTIIYTISPFRKLENVSVYFYYYVMFLRNCHEEVLRGLRYKVWMGNEEGDIALNNMLNIFKRKTLLKNYWQILVINCSINIKKIYKTIILPEMLAYYNFKSKFEKE